MTVFFWFIPIILFLLLYPLACYGLIHVLLWWQERFISDEEDARNPMLVVERVLTVIRSRPLLYVVMYPAMVLIGFCLGWGE